MRRLWLFVPAVLLLFDMRRVGAESATEAERLGEWVRQLGSDRYAVRNQADLELRKQSALVVPLLERQRVLTSHLEQHRRLERVITSLRLLPWHDDLAAAQADARATGRPLLIFSTIGDIHGFG